MRRLQSCCLLFFFFSPLSAPVLAQKELAPLPVEDVLSALNFASTPIYVSPDGEWVAYTLCDPTKRGRITDLRYYFFSRSGVPSISAVGCDIWITNTESGDSTKLTEGKGSSWGPVWSPDGNYLAFYSDRGGKAHVWLWERFSGKFRQVSDAIVRPLRDSVVHWAPDSRKILTRILPEGMTTEDAPNLTSVLQARVNKGEKETETSVIVYRSPASPKETGSAKQDIFDDDIFSVPLIADLALIDISNLRVERIARGFKPHWYGISPDGANVAFTAFKGRQAVGPPQTWYDLVVVSLPTGRSQVVASNVRQDAGTNVSWSPDGKLIAYTTSKGEPFIVPASGGEPRKAIETSPAGLNVLGAPVWDKKGEFLYFLSPNRVWKVPVSNGKATPLSRDLSRVLVAMVSPGDMGRFWSPDGGRSILVRTQDDDTRQVGFYNLDLTTGEFSKLYENNIFISKLEVSAAGQSIVYVAEDSQHGPDIWIASVDFRNRRRLTRINRHLERYAMGESRLIEWRSTDGQRLRGALLLPANYEAGRRYPLIVTVYGGAFLSNSLNQFGLGGTGLSLGVENMQLFATRGYAVLFPDAPLRVGTPMQDLTRTVLPGVNRVTELGIADPDRIGVMGHSYGGYSALCLIAQTTRFKAAVMSAGPGNLISMYGVLNGEFSKVWTEGQGRMGGAPWEFRERYIENSPAFYLDRVQTPLLIIHGDLDFAVPPFLADEIFVSLRRLGKDVMYAKYHREAHWILDYPNMRDCYNRIVVWFDERLRKTKEN